VRATGDITAATKGRRKGDRAVVRKGARGPGRLALAPLALVIAATPATLTTASATGALEPRAEQPAAVELSGAGSTFDAPFFSAAFVRYHQLRPAVSVSYAAVGSGDGIKRFSAGTVDFGASDVPMTAAEQAGARGGPIVQVPVDLGAVVVSYNLDNTGGLSVPLQLTGPVLARIYLGRITKWDDPAITALNPSDDLPDEQINVVHRSDGSGTTYIFTNYLSSVSPAWAAGPGTSKTIKWPVGFGGNGSRGVAALLKVLPGSIGYFELSYAESQNLPYAFVQNRSGAFVPPFAANVAADASVKQGLSASDFSIVDGPGPQSYPISGYSWALLYARQANSVTGTALVNLVDWLTHAGQPVAGANYYVPLPPAIQGLAQATLKEVTGPSGNVLLP
jgi:phosphate transport system substrate-binding protein